MSLDSAVNAEIIEEDLLRAHVYRLLAKLMRAGPDQETLNKLTNLNGDDTELGQALGALARVAGKVTAAEAAEEYQDLFIGVGRGELLPYGSYYLTGFLNEKPLAKLRKDMGQLGIERRDAVSEPEDHIAALCEMMAGLVTGEYGEPLDLAGQKTFFDTHIAPWAAHFFADLEAAKSSKVYASIGSIGRSFIAIETEAFRMLEN
ncbi:MAG: molecular chaperone TorD family protein [Hyphomicrobiales bacterium]|nr:molecular chaperone TorD family protein [Hyphomicrobiales bacterium]